MQPEFQKTLQAADQIQAPTSPLGNFPELANFFKNSFQSPTRQAGLGAYATQNQIATGNAEAGAAYARKLKISELSDKANKMDPSNPDNYKKIAKDDGGYDFVDPSGAKISVQQYSRAITQLTGKKLTPEQVLSDSTNSIDRQFVQDHANLEKLINASINGDVEGRNKLALQVGGKELVNYLDKGKATPDQLIQQFMSYYPHIYGVKGAPSGASTVRNGAGLIGYTPTGK